MRSHKDAFFFIIIRGPFGFVLNPHTLNKYPYFFLLGRPTGKLHNQGVFRSHHHKGGTQDCVLACREDRDMAVPVFQGELDLSPHALPDPVPLHRHHFLGPPRQVITIFKKVVSIIRDTEEPLVQLLLDYHLAAPPA